MPPPPSRSRGVAAAVGALAAVVIAAACAGDDRDRFRCEPDQTCLQRDPEGNPYVCYQDHCWPRAELPDSGEPDAGPGDGGDGGDAGPDEDAGPDVVEPLDAGPDYGMIDLGPHCRANGLLCVENPVSGGDRLNGVDGRGWNDVWVVGAGNTVLQWNGVGWRRTVLRDGLTKDMLDVDVTDAGIAVVGEFRRAAIWDAGWKVLDPAINTNLLEFGSASLFDEHLFVAGEFGALAVVDITDGGTANHISSEAQSAYAYIWADAPNTAWVVRDGGIGRVTYAPSTATATVTYSAMSGVFRDIDGTSPSNVYVVGDDGTILERGLGVWTNLAPLSTRPSYSSVSAEQSGAWMTSSDAGSLYNINSVAAVLSYAYPGGDALLLRDVWSNGEGEVWAVGEKGLIVRRDGADFVRAPGSATPQLHAIAQGPGRRLFAVGANRTVLMRRGTTWVPLLKETLGADNAFFDLSSTADGMWIATAGLRRLEWSVDAGATLGPLIGSQSYRAIGETPERPLFAVGLAGAYAAYVPPSTWTTATAPWGSVDIYAAEESRDGKTIWVSGRGVVYEATDAGWVNRTGTLPPNVSYDELWVESANDVWVAGVNGSDATASELYHYADGSWTGHDAGERVTAIAGRNGKLWVATGGRILEWTGSGWRDLGQLAGASFNTRFVSSAGVWFAGSDGVIARLDAGQ